MSIRKMGAAVAAVLVVGGRGYAQVSPSEAWAELDVAQQKIKSSSQTWTYTEHQISPKRSPEVLARAKATFARNIEKQGLKGAQAEKELELTMSMYVGKPGGETFSGTKICKNNGSVAGEERRPKGTDPKSKGTRTYANGTVCSLYTSPALPGEIHKDYANAFGMTGGIALDPLVLAHSPVTAMFNKDQATSVAGKDLTLTITPSQQNPFEQYVKVNYETGVISEAGYRPLGKSAKGGMKYTVLATRKEGAFEVPSQVLFETFWNDGAIHDRTQFDLADEKLNDEAAVAELADLGADGSAVIDYRFGEDKPRRYISSSLLPDAEVLQFGKPIATKTGQSQSQTRLLYAISAALVAIGLTIKGIQLKRRTAA